MEEETNEKEFGRWRSIFSSQNRFNIPWSDSFRVLLNEQHKKLEYHAQRKRIRARMRFGGQKRINKLKKLRNLRCSQKTPSSKVMHAEIADAAVRWIDKYLLSLAERWRY